MDRALQWAGYEVEHVWGEDAHNHNHGAAIFPQAMRWLWKDYPQPVVTHLDRSKEILAWDLQTRESEVIAAGFASNDRVVLHDSSIYVTDPEGKQIWYIDPAKRAAKPVDTFDGCNGITVSPDQSLLYVAHFPGRFIYSYQIAADGSLHYKQPSIHLLCRPNRGCSGWQPDPASRCGMRRLRPAPPQPSLPVCWTCLLAGENGGHTEAQAAALGGRQVPAAVRRPAFRRRSGPATAPEYAEGARRGPTRIGRW